jgi:thiol-disulfide isomerase/thioredoxin
MTGLVVVAVVLAAALAFGLWRRATDGRLRPVGAVPAPVPADTAAAHEPFRRGDDEAADVLAPDELGVALGERATLVQFSTVFCQPCRATRQVLARVAAQVDGVAHVEIDAESHLDLVRRLRITRTPTVLVLDSRGRVVRRATGAPRHADVVNALSGAVS